MIQQEWRIGYLRGLSRVQASGFQSGKRNFSTRVVKVKFPIKLTNRKILIQDDLHDAEKQKVNTQI